MLKSKNRWSVKKVDENKVQRLAKSLHVSLLTARLLLVRGIDDASAAGKFLSGSSAPCHDAAVMKGMLAACARIRRALDGEEPIRIFGDYDADGVTATAILVRALRAAGGHVSSYIPNRFKEGYGPNVAAVERAKQDGVKLIVTVDSGIAAYDPAACAQRLGIDYIITDHHEPPAQLPPVPVIVNPKQDDCPYPFKGLSGAGIALKLAREICPADLFDENWLALAAIGTVADLVPLRDENRLIVRRGLKKINEHTLPGIHALKVKASGAGEIDSDTIGFQLAPRLNAAGRMEDADTALKLLLAESDEEASALADHLDELNQERRAIVEQIVRESERQAADYIRRGDRALVLAGRNWHQGVIGIAASKIVEKYYRPVIMLSIDEATGIAKGSGRSVEGFDLYRGLSACAGHLLQFGGHQMAAGMTIAETEIESFRDAFTAVAARALTSVDLVPHLSIDAVVSVEDLSVKTIEELAAFAPFGTDNPRPLFQVGPAELAKMTAVGREGAHLKLLLKNGDCTLDAIGFGLGDRMALLTPADQPIAVGEAGINEWNGFRKPQLVLRDLRVDGIQVFDWRSAAQHSERVHKLRDQPVTLLAFHPDTAAHFGLKDTVRRYEPDMVIDHEAVAFLDVPDEENQLADFIAGNPQIHRFYCIFYHSEDHYFSAFPEREQFAWFYAWIRQKGRLEVAPAVRQIAGYKGWSEQMISLMTQVFFELDFVKIEKGILTVNPSPTKTPLTASKIYQQEKMQRELEARLCYSPTGELKQWLAGQFRENACVSK